MDRQHKDGDGLADAVHDLTRKEKNGGDLEPQWRMQKQIASSGEIGDLRDAALAEASLCRLRNCFKNAGDAEAVQAADIGLFRYPPERTRAAARGTSRL